MTTRHFLFKIIRKFFLSKIFNFDELFVLSDIINSAGIKNVITDKNESIIPVDKVVFPRILTNIYREYALPDMACEYLEKQRHLVFVNVGAHVGLTAKEFIYEYNPTISYIYEPDKDNYNLLQLNLFCLQNHDLKILNHALSDENKDQILFRDEYNSVSHSLIQNAIHSSHPTDSVKVSTLDIQEESLKWISSEANIFYLSDTQGMDEILFYRIHERVFHRICGIMIEIFSIQGKYFDEKVFIERISSFTRFYIRKNELISSITLEKLIEIIRETWSSQSRECFDVICFK